MKLIEFLEPRFFKRRLLFIFSLFLIYQFRVFFTWLVYIAFHLSLLFSYSYFNFLYTRNITTAPYMQNVGNKCFELTQDVLIYHYDQINYIDSAGRKSWLPVSVEDYENYGDNWNHSEAYLKIFHNDPHESGKENVIGVLKKGTKLRFIKILKEIGAFGEVILNPIVEVMNNQHKGLVSEILLVDTETNEDPPTLTVDTEYLQPCEP